MRQIGMRQKPADWAALVSVAVNFAVPPGSPISRPYRPARRAIRILPSIPPSSRDNAASSSVVLTTNWIRTWTRYATFRLRTSSSKPRKVARSTADRYLQAIDVVRVQRERAESEGEQAFTGEGNWVVMPVDRVKEIVALNKEGKEAGRTHGRRLEVESKKKRTDYANVVGQDRIDRMDRRRRKKKKKKSSGGGNAQQSRSNKSGTGRTTPGWPARKNADSKVVNNGSDPTTVRKRQRNGPRPQQNQQQGGKPSSRVSNRTNSNVNQQGQSPQQQGQNNNRQQQQGPRPQQQPTPASAGRTASQQEPRPQGGNREPRQRPSAPPRQSPGQSTPPPESN